jgi:hypothetical protein
MLIISVDTISSFTAVKITPIIAWTKYHLLREHEVSNFERDVCGCTTKRVPAVRTWWSVQKVTMIIFVMSRMLNVFEILAEGKEILSKFIHQHGFTRLIIKKWFTQRNLGTPFMIYMDDFACWNEQTIVDELAHSNISPFLNLLYSQYLSPCDLCLFEFRRSSSKNTVIILSMQSSPCGEMSFLKRANPSWKNGCGSSHE